jgi:hypothetical protein
MDKSTLNPDQKQRAPHKYLTDLLNKEITCVANQIHIYKHTLMHVLAKLSDKPRLGLVLCECAAAEINHLSERAPRAV